MACLGSMEPIFSTQKKEVRTSSAENQENEADHLNIAGSAASKPVSLLPGIAISCRMLGLPAWGRSTRSKLRPFLHRISIQSQRPAAGYRSLCAAKPAALWLPVPAATADRVSAQAADSSCSQGRTKSATDKLTSVELIICLPSSLPNLKAAARQSPAPNCDHNPDQKNSPPT